MIAKVRIAPVERWCEESKRRVNEWPERGKKIPGFEVEIETARMRTEGAYECQAREWPLTEGPARALQSFIAGYEALGQNIWICEHMLEMD